MSHDGSWRHRCQGISKSSTDIIATRLKMHDEHIQAEMERITSESLESALRDMHQIMISYLTPQKEDYKRMACAVGIGKAAVYVGVASLAAAMTLDPKMAKEMADRFMSQMISTSSVS